MCGMSYPDGASPRHQNFEAVLAAAQAGAPWACTEIWVEFAPAVSAFLRARGSREPDDVTSEVFIAVLDQLPKFIGGPAELRSFIFSIAYRRLVDELRMRSRRGEHSEFTAGIDPRHVPSAEQQAISRLGDASALSLLDQLPPDQRDVMILRIVSDLTIEQIAEVVGKRVGAVKALQRRALESLRKKLEHTRTLSGLPDDSDK
jgi:RNA polymerase sigma-70 factor (ECF subfamily)